MTTENKDTAKAGKLLMMDHGEYSDYSVTGFFVVLKDFKPMDKLSEYLDSRPKQKEHYEFERHEFLAWLISLGLLMEIDYDTLYLGSYGSADLNFS